MSAKKKAGHIAAMVAGGIALAVGLAFLLGFVVQALWNWVMPDIFPGLPEITYWQAWGLFVLAHLLLGGAKFHNSKHNGGFKAKLKHKFGGGHLCCGGEEDAAPEPEPQQGS